MMLVPPWVWHGITVLQTEYLMNLKRNLYPIFSGFFLLLLIGCGANESAQQKNTVPTSLQAQEVITKEDAPLIVSQETVAIASLELESSTIIMKPGNITRLNVIVKDSNGYPINIDNNNLTWESAEPLTASIDYTGLIIAKQEGICEIRVRRDDMVSQPVEVVVSNTVPKPYPIDVVFPYEDSLKEASYSSGLRVYFEKNISGGHDLDWSSIRLFLNGEEVTAKATIPLCQDKLCGWVDYDAKQWFPPGDYSGEVRFKTISGELKDYIWRFRIYWYDQANRPPEIGVWPPEDSKPFVLDAIRVYFKAYPEISLLCNLQEDSSQSHEDWYESHQLYIDGNVIESKIYSGFDCFVSLSGELNSVMTGSTAPTLTNVVIEYRPSPPLTPGKHTVKIEIRTHLGHLIEYEWSFDAP